MKKKLTRIWGVGLVIVLMSTLCLIPASPVSAADELRWNEEVIPGIPGYVVNPGSTITDLAVSVDDDIMYAVGGAWNQVIYRSDNLGVMWTEIDTDAGTKVSGTPINADFVAVAIDDSDMVVIADQVDGDATDGLVYVSVDGATEFGLLGDLTAIAGAGITIHDVAISPEAGGAHQVAFAIDDAGANAEVWTIELGIGGSWTEQRASATGEQAGTTDALAVAFSPNFASDLTLAAVTTDGVDTFFEILQMTTTPEWNADAGFDNYPVTMEDSAGNPFAAQGASIAMAPTYIGGDEMERVAFVGIDAVGAAVNGDGVYRLEDYICKHILTERDIYSVAFDGSTCVAGVVTGTTVWRSADPLTSIPTFRGSASLKSPGGVDSVVVDFAGTTVVAATNGNESCFSISEDNGQSFNDISLIDTAIADISDISVSPDGAQVYMATDDGADLSVWRFASSWQRVLSVQGILNPYIVRVAPDDPDIVYVAEYTGQDLYYSKAGGDTKWYNRSAPDDIQDLAVESSDVAYIALLGSKNVTKTDNGGFVWDSEVNTELIAGDVYTIECIGEDLLLVGSTAGCVSYSTDGNDSWNKLAPFAAGATNVQVAADGLEEGNHIYAASDANSLVYMWTIGTAPSEPWDNVSAGGVYAGGWVTGMTMQGGTLYAAVTDGVNSTFTRNTMPWMPEIGFVFWSCAADVADDFDNMPSQMRLSGTADYNKIWSCGDTTLYSYMDSLAVSAPTPLHPDDGATVAINAELGVPYNVTFTWTRPSKANNYTIMIALDPFFQEVVCRLPDCVNSVYDTISFTLTDTYVPAAGGFGNLSTLTPGNTYYWAVQASQPLTSGLSSMPGRSFTLESGAAVAPTIGSPANGASNVSGTPAFSWSPVAGATMYEFQLAVGTTFTETLYSGTLPETGIRPPVELDPGVTYFWRVRSIEPVVGDWSTIANFMVAVPAEEPPPPVEIIQQPAPIIEIPAPEPAPIINIPAAPEQPAPTAQGYIWAIIIIGAILVIALVVLIVRTRRQV